MSCFLYLFLRKDNVFVPLISVGRSDYLSKLFRDAPYEAVHSISRNKLGDLIDGVAEITTSFHLDISRKKKTITTVSNFIGNSAEEKLNIITSCYDDIEELKNSLQELNDAKKFLITLQKILIESAFVDGIDPDKYLYAGFECGYDVTDDDTT